MDASKWKSVAVKKEDHDLLKAVSKYNYRGPAAQITKMLDEEIVRLANRKGINPAECRRILLASYKPEEVEKKSLEAARAADRSGF
jgi:hypothetical protein|tara:strand:- start:444 stop:701 length:258 start_codon:yes stop_codon:yes gene_type:complete